MKTSCSGALSERFAKFVVLVDSIDLGVLMGLVPNLKDLILNAKRREKYAELRL
jgi:hypothetical protein